MTIHANIIKSVHVLCLFTCGLIANIQAQPYDQNELLGNIMVKPVPVTRASRPYAMQTPPLAQFGYIQEEFFISGLARVYDWVDGSWDIAAISAAVPYTTRIIVLRPKSPAKFSGNVVVEVLNASTGTDISGNLQTSSDYLMRSGDAWIGVTHKHININALKRFDPARYGELGWGNPAPDAFRCDNPNIIPKYNFGSWAWLFNVVPVDFSFDESADGLFYEIYAQLGMLLKSPLGQKILPDVHNPTLIAAGYSQSALVLRTFTNGFHPAFRLTGDAPVYDGYLMEVGPAMLSINQCASDIPPEDERNTQRKIDVPIINIVSEGDMWLGLKTRSEDVVAPEMGIVTYELPGFSHKANMGGNGYPPADDRKKAGFRNASLPLPRLLGRQPNDLPRGYYSRAAYHNLKAWINRGQIPPQASPIHSKENVLLRDAHGNSLGGVPSPWLNVPAARYWGNRGSGPMAIVGSKALFSVSKMNTLYSGRRNYISLVKNSVREIVEQRWLLPEDEEDILSHINEHTWPDKTQ